MQSDALKTPDGRYIVVDQVLWRTTRPDLLEGERRTLVSELMAARREIRDAKGDTERIKKARKRVHTAKVALGERGPVWWDDDAPDYNRFRVTNTPYADWFCTLTEGQPI